MGGNATLGNVRLPKALLVSTARRPPDHGQPHQRLTPVDALEEVPPPEKLSKEDDQACLSACPGSPSSTLPKDESKSNQI